MCFWVTIILLTNRSKEVSVEIKFNKMKINLHFVLDLAPKSCYTVLEVREKRRKQNA